MPGPFIRPWGKLSMDLQWSCQVQSICERPMQMIFYPSSYGRTCCFIRWWAYCIQQVVLCCYNFWVRWFTNPPLPNPKMIRKHSSRMPTARLRRPYLLQQQLNGSMDSVGVLMWTSLKRSSVMTTRCHWQGGGPCTMRSHVQKGPGPGPGGLYSEV